MVSIIVPVYNVKPYINDCVIGVLKQSYQDWELLLIDDGSSDGSSEVCDQIAELDSRIVVVHKQNTGVSDTRNHGLDLARGDYVIFLDSDDFWYDFTFLEKFVDLADTHQLDIIRGEYKAVDLLGCDLFVKEEDELKRISENMILNSTLFLDNILQREFFLPLCLIRIEVIRNIRFNTNRVFLEDVEFFLRILLKSVKCLYTPVYFYAYRKHDSSASNIYNKKRLSDAFDMSALYRDLSLTNIEGKLSQSFKKRSWDYYWLTLRTMATENVYYDKSRQLSEDLNIDELRCSLQQLIPSIVVKHKWIHKLSPFLAICYFRLRYLVGKILRNIKSI